MAPPGATTSATSQQAAESVAQSATTPARQTAPSLRRNATDDEILGISDVHRKDSRSKAQPDEQPAETGSLDGGEVAPVGDEGERAAPDSAATEEEALQGVFDANPKLRAAWEDAQAYRKVFATPQEAQAATALLADLNRMDALFFSQRAEDHAQLAHAIADLDPAAFASLARAINAQLANNAGRAGERHSVASANSRAGRALEGSEALEGRGQENEAREVRQQRPEENAARAEARGLTPEQAEFFHSANVSAVEGVLEAIESQVERLLPEGVNKNARGRVVGEIYRELDATLRSNRQLAQQLREAFRSGSLDEEHRRAVVSLITGRARQALPGVAKRVLQEWTSTLVAANQDRRARQRSAEHRVDIAGSGGTGSDGRRTIGPRNIDYARMSDADILNL